MWGILKIFSPDTPSTLNFQYFISWDISITGRNALVKIDKYYYNVLIYLYVFFFPFLFFTTYQSDSFQLYIYIYIYIWIARRTCRPTEVVGMFIIKNFFFNNKHAHTFRRAYMFSLAINKFLTIDDLFEYIFIIQRVITQFR